MKIKMETFIGVALGITGIFFSSFQAYFDSHLAHKFTIMGFLFFLTLSLLRPEKFRRNLVILLRIVHKSAGILLIILGILSSFQTVVINGSPAITGAAPLSLAGLGFYFHFVMCDALYRLQSD